MTERFSHLQVAMTVKLGMADAGMGIKAAADALDLDFIPLHEEEYHIILPKESGELAKKIIKILSSDEWRDMVARLGGYDISESGKVV